MSEQRKRLTDDQLKSARAAYDAGEVSELSEDELFDDHFQAREDRKRLCDAIRAAIHIGAIETWRTFDLILREVDPQ